MVLEDVVFDNSSSVTPNTVAHSYRIRSQLLSSNTTSSNTTSLNSVNNLVLRQKENLPGKPSRGDGPSRRQDQGTAQCSADPHSPSSKCSHMGTSWGKSRDFSSYSKGPNRGQHERGPAGLIARRMASIFGSDLKSK